MREKIDSFLKALRRAARDERASRIVNFVLVPLLVLAALWLPPISIKERILEAGYTAIGEGNWSVEDPDGTRLTIPAEGLAGPVKLKLTSVPRLDFLKGSAGEKLLQAAEAIPSHLEMKSPLYQISLLGQMPTEAVLSVVIPNDAEPYRTLDLYTWTGEEWRWLPSRVVVEDDAIVSQLSFVPPSVAAMQTKPLPPVVSTDLAPGQAVPPKGEGVLTEINPCGLLLGEGGEIEGEVSVPPGAAAYAILPTVRNWDEEGIRGDLLSEMLTDEQLRAQHVSSLVELAVEGGYAGLDLDYRGLDPALRDEFSRFVAELAEGLHREGKLLTLAVEPPTPPPSPSPHAGRVGEGDRWETGAYDWRALGEVVDGLKVPLDPLDGRWEALLDWAVGEVNRYKLQPVISARSLEAVGEALVEVPFAEALAPLARIALEGVGQPLEPGQEVTLSLATLRESGGLNFDQETQTYWFSYTDDEGCRRTVWLEDAGSMAHKLRLVARYNLRGVAVRGLAEEGNDRRIWAVLRQFAQLAVPEVKSQFAVVWTVRGVEGELEEETKPLSDPRYVWRAPPQPGQYTVAAAISPDGGRTVSSRAGVALRVAAPTPTPTPTPMPTPTPTATPTPTSTPTPPPKPTAAAPPPPPKPPAPRAAGFFGYGIQAHMIDQDHGPIINAIKGLGFNWVKQQIEWKRFEPAKGQYAWGEIDRLVDSCHAAGLNILLSVVKAPKWARPANTDFSVEGPPANPQDFADFLAAMAARYCGRVQAIEVWNEQNINYEWGNEPPDPGRYVQLLAASYKAIKSVCPQMIVVSGALTPAGDVTIGGQWRAVDDINYLEAMYRHGLKHYCDAVGAHPSGYNVPPDADWRTWSDPTAKFRGPSDNRHHSWVFRGTMEGYRNVMLKYGDGGKRIWPTEFGWASVEGLGVEPAPGYEYAADNTEAEQAQFIVRAYQMGKSWGWVGPMFLWNLNFGPVCGPHDEKAAFSILYPDWRPRPAYAALRDMPK